MWRGVSECHRGPYGGGRKPADCRRLSGGQRSGFFASVMSPNFWFDIATTRRVAATAGDVPVSERQPLLKLRTKSGRRSLDMTIGPAAVRLIVLMVAIFVLTALTAFGVFDPIQFAHC